MSVVQVGYHAQLVLGYLQYCKLQWQSTCTSAQVRAAT